VIVVIAAMCASYFGVEDDGIVHAVSGAALLIVLAVKIAVIRRFHGASRWLPVLGSSVFVLLAITWASSAGAFLAEH
jgi:hypothetical protein